MSASDLARVVEHNHQSLNALVRGDPEPQKQLFSRRDDVTFATTVGPPVRGWKAVAEILERAASLLHDGEPIAFERVSEYATADLAYIVEIERNRTKVAGTDVPALWTRRVTTIFRREDDGWKIAHRHADSMVAVPPAQPVAQ